MTLERKPLSPAGPPADRKERWRQPHEPLLRRDLPTAPAASDIDQLLNETEQTLRRLDLPNYATESPASTFSGNIAANLDSIGDVELDLKIELGRAEMTLEDVAKLNSGSVVPLDKLVSDPVDIVVNGRLVARGQVLVLNDNFCVRVTELVGREGLEVSKTPFLRGKGD